MSAAPFRILCALVLLAVASPAQGRRGTGGRRPRHVPITRPVDVNWPPVIAQPGYPPGTVYPGEPAALPEKRRIVEVRLDDCMDNSPAAGYSFVSERIVSCEDSTVDLYLSYTDDGSYYFLVPEDTDIKDIGFRRSLGAVHLLKPDGWSADHGARLTAGHVYVVWTYAGDFFLVMVSVLWEKHVMFQWTWHSNLSRKDAAEFLKNNPDGPPQAPFFRR